MSRDLDDDGHAAAVGSVIAAAAAVEGAEAAEVTAVGGGGAGEAAAAGDEHDNDVLMPGFRFHPTEEELIEFYLRRKVEGKRFNVELIAFLDLYRFDPWELPAMAVMGGKEWFFYVPRDRKYRNGDRPNRVTASGYWKATGADRMIRGENNRPIGLKKTLVFYSGKAPKGVRSSWIMNEYRLPPPPTDADALIPKSEISLCRVYKRSGIDDGHGQSSSSTQASSARRTSSRTVAPLPTTVRHGSSPSSSTPLSPTPQQQLSSFHLLQGECSSASASPPVPMMDHQVVTAHSAPPQLLLPHPRPCTYAPPVTTTMPTVEAAPPQSAPATATALASTYSLFNMAAGGAPMAGSSRPVDELSTLGIGPTPTQAYDNLSVAMGGQLLPLLTTPPPPMLQMTPPLGARPMIVPPSSSVADKLISWDWNPIPDTTDRDYNPSGFKPLQQGLFLSA